jgi:hypothetical protein
VDALNYTCSWHERYYLIKSRAFFLAVRARTAFRNVFEGTNFQKSKNIVAYLLFIIIVGPPLTLFDPTNYVKTWLLQGHHSAIDTKSKIRKRTEEVGDMSKVWKLL